MAKLKEKSNRFMWIPSEDEITPMELAVSNSKVFGLLKKKPNADIYHYAIPHGNQDIFRRRIRVVKVDKTDINPANLVDVPDLNDMHFTNLPWAGHSGFEGASRQFRSKKVLAVVVDVHRQFDGFIYGLFVDAGLEVPEHPPILAYWTRAEAHEDNHSVEFDLTPNEAKMKAYFDGAPILPPTLVKEMLALGYVEDGDGFLLKHANVDRCSARIKVQLYGKLIEKREGESHVQIRAGA